MTRHSLGIFVVFSASLRHRSGDNLRNVGGYHAGFQLVKLVHC